MMRDKIIQMLTSKGVTVPENPSDEFLIGALAGGRYGKETAVPTTPTPASQGNGFVEPLLGCNPQEVSPARAGAVFAQYARGLCDTENCDLTTAWNKAKILKPELFARLQEGNAENSTLQNEDKPKVQAVPLASKAFVAAQFSLPTNVDNGIFEAAWKANGSQSERVNSQNIFHGLVVYYATKSRQTVESARRQVIDDFPALARAAGQTIA